MVGSIRESIMCNLKIVVDITGRGFSRSGVGFSRALGIS